MSLTDTLPSGVTFVSATGGIAPVNGVLTFALGSLDAGADASVTIVVTPTAAGPLSDTAAASMDQTDPTPADNSVTLPTTVAAVAGTADLALSGSVPSSVTLGNTVTYTLTVTNQGTATATGVTLTDTLPSGRGLRLGDRRRHADGRRPDLHPRRPGRRCGQQGHDRGHAHRRRPVNDVAKVSMDQTEPNPANNTLTLSTTVAPASGTPGVDFHGNAHGHPGRNDPEPDPPPRPARRSSRSSGSASTTLPTKFVLTFTVLSTPRRPAIRPAIAWWTWPTPAESSASARRRITPLTRA